MVMYRELGPGELQKFVDSLIARSPGVQDEVRRITRVQKHRKYILEKATRVGLAHRKRRVVKKPTKEATAARVETKRLKAIDAHGVCKTCGDRPISHGDSLSSQRAGLEEKCRVCYDGSHGRKTARECGREVYTTKIDENGLCPKCEAHAISGGVSEISVLARDDGLCIYCYRASRTRRSRTPRPKICRKCCVEHVARGVGQLSVVARRKGLCLGCHRYGDGEGE